MYFVHDGQTFPSNGVAVADEGEAIVRKLFFPVLAATLLGTTTFAAIQRNVRDAPFGADALLIQRLQVATPFQNNNGALPQPGQYPGPLFTVNHGWPTRPLAPLTDAPWQAAIGGGRITVANAPAYAAALKAAVSANGRALVVGHGTWNAATAGWYNEPWLGSQREAISGTYQAGEFGPAIFPGTGLRTTFQTNVLTYYDARAAATLNGFWGAPAMQPTLTARAAQFDEGAIIVKAALFSSEDPGQPTGWWDALQGAASWPLFIGVGPSGASPAPAPRVWPGYVAQFDIIVKDSQSAPDTGWVFMTLVYDPRAPGGDAWDKMVPLGVQWGNDPQATRAGMPLTQNWINPAAPLYSTQTLGWGGRLSGPNDGGRNDIEVNGVTQLNAPDSGCISCHSTAEWDVKQHRMMSFLLPSIPTSSPPYFKLCGAGGNLICSPAPGSAAWMKWFQNRRGDVAMDAGSFGTDFDEVFSFKSLKLWWLAVGPKNQAMPQLKVQQVPGVSVRFNQYSGAPLRPAAALR